MTSEEQQRRGLAVGMGAYLFWGFLPVYLKALAGVPPVEVVADRIVASLLLMLALLAVRRDLPDLWRNLRDRRTVLPLAASAVMIATNWLVYVYAVVEHHILAASLGYFLNPLVNVALGMLFLKERLRPMQAVAVGIAFAGVALMAATALDTLWISAALALSFGLYGLIRKTSPVGPAQGLALETLLLAPMACGYLAFVVADGRLVFGQETGTTLLLAGLGIATCVPLLMFATAARIVSLTTLGLLQYVSRSLIFFTGWLIYGEPLDARKLASFAVIWTALAIFTWDTLRDRRTA